MHKVQACSETEQGNLIIEIEAVWFQNPVGLEGVKLPYEKLYNVMVYWKGKAWIEGGYMQVCRSEQKVWDFINGLKVAASMLTKQSLNVPNSLPDFLPDPNPQDKN